MMYFLGQAANFKGKVLSHTFATGSKKDFDALKSHYSSSYNVELSSSGESICFYRKGKKPSFKNLVCAVYGNALDLISFGPNENLKDSLGKQIIEVINEI